jgi:acyl dehydratase
MRFEDFAVGHTFAALVTITKKDFDIYISFARTRNILHENPQLAEKEGIKGTMLPGRSIIARAEGEMTRLPAFSGCVMLLYGMDGDPTWNNRNTRFLGEVYAGEELEVKYIVSEKKDDKGYGILAIDFVISRVRDNKLVVISRRNLYRIKPIPDPCSTI